MKKIMSPLLCDFYKVGHVFQYPEGTEKIYSTYTPRGSRIDGVDEVVFWNLQGFINEFLIGEFNENFFNRAKRSVIAEYEDYVRSCLVQEPNSKHISDLHDLGYLPIKICSLAEGTRVPMRVPCFTVENTIPKFFWVTNALETLISAEMWHPITVATIADSFRRLLNRYAMETVGSTCGVEWQGHDFSLRGMSGIYNGGKLGGGHLLSFNGTDNIPAIHYMKWMYGASLSCGGSVNATEHSVQCANMPEDFDEYETIKRLMTDVYPTGMLSIVMDTLDFWRNIEEVLPRLKNDIMKRDGKIICRPDTGDPADMICGGINAHTDIERKGLIEALWDIFGGTVSDQGYKVLDQHIGAIYGDSITLNVAADICARLKQKGFASTNIVFGIGSYTYQHVTRDTFNQAIKSTYSVINGKEKMLFKDPKTGNGMKRSQRGMVAVVDDGLGSIKVVDNLTLTDKLNINNDLLITKFVNGDIYNYQSIDDIKAKMNINK